MKYVDGLRTGQKLIELGLLPLNTTTFELITDFKMPVRLRIERYLTHEQYDRFISVMTEFGEPVEITAN
jgi:hypothetical protein